MYIRIVGVDSYVYVTIKYVYFYLYIIGFIVKRVMYDVQCIITDCDSILFGFMYPMHFIWILTIQKHKLKIIMDYLLMVSICQYI